MSTYFVGIDISKYKHDCCIINVADQSIVVKFTIQNDKDGFNELLTSLQSLSAPEDIRIGFESTAHYALNLELFLEKAHHSFMEVNPVLISEYKKSTSLRRTKTDSVDLDLSTQYWYEYGRPCGFLFTKKRGGDMPIDTFFLSRHIHAHEKRLGLKHRLTCHSFRHALGTHLYENGTDLLTIKALMGHKSLNSTTIYVNLSAGFKKYATMAFLTTG